ncbi:uncharacterized protein LOC106719152 [Papilio machaon]|uniref:uncharacterized protein LOC106719152 n=1 Tax=Papilio machaon TaxID=76193 RepID=UPI001E662E4C|nr:uncharacterized protein LOC106719152 [Papilio machaon]
MRKSDPYVYYVKKRLKNVQISGLRRGLQSSELKQIDYICNFTEENTIKKTRKRIIILIVIVSILTVVVSSIVHNILTARCLVPLNYLVWEATRPLADCDYCVNITKPIILHNVTRDNFKIHAYTSKPIVIKNVINHWRAVKYFNYYLFKRFYEHTMGSYELFDEGCQFLNFKSDLFSLKEVFSMPKERIMNAPGQKPWYVGWANCHPDIKSKIRQYYSIPEFLPDDAEFPETENIFFGYEIGAVMHLDYIPRLMWQGQIKGSKNWSIAPVPECEQICHKFQFYVESGDVVLLDTRVWYHATSIPKGQFSVTLQSEYA